MIGKVFAATSDIGQYLDQAPGGNPWRDIQNINTLVPGLLNAALVIAFAIFVFLLIFAGIQWITAGGDKAKVESAQKKLTGAIIGIIIVISAWAILGLVKNFFNLSSTTGSGGGGEEETRDCVTVCREELVTCPEAYAAVCFNGCICQCNHRGEMWSHGECEN